MSKRQPILSLLPALSLRGLAILAPLVLVPPAIAQLLPADRATTWKPGIPRGEPARTTVCATLNASSYGNGSSDATGGIQAAINGCPVGQVVKLSAGVFLINNDVVNITKGITLRGSGPGVTILKRTNGAQPGTYVPGPKPDPVIIMGPSRWASTGTSFNLAADAPKGATSVQLTTAPASFTAGQIVLLDELSGAAWQTDPGGRGQVWASPDWRVVYQRHNPSQPTDDPWPDAAGWFARQDRPQNEVKEVASWDAATKTLTFTSPLHISYRTSHTAQIYVYAAVDTHTRNAALEDVTVQGGGDGNIRLERCAYCWVARVEGTGWLGEGVALNGSYRCELRDSYIHTPVWFEPGGGSYNISIGGGSAELLIENNISVDADKVMVARSAGSGSVVAYNYMDDGHIGSNPSWQEIGLNASHMVGAHHVLFEGNYGFNFDSDKTHGSSTYMTVFRNHLSGDRRSFNDGAPKRTAGAAMYSYWMSYIGNVLGTPGGMTGWVYESGTMQTPAVYLFGWDDWSPYPVDPMVKATALREGNFDYLTNQVHWDTVAQTLPASLYLTSKPAFFGNNTWPWVDPTGTTKLYTLPAKARYTNQPAAKAAFYTVTPCRVADTRNATGPSGGPALAAGKTRDFQVVGICGIPMDARAVATNVTVVTPPMAGYLTLFPPGLSQSLTSTINLSPGKTRANNNTIGLGMSNSVAQPGVSVFSGIAAGQVHLILDVVGYFK